ncbi:Protein YciF [Verrucomicrobia bacterium]|nr:Protein YciF [Verrucomicrobiota bacterium]
METLDSLESLLLHEIKDLYHAEKQLVKALPKVIKKASSSELRNAIEQHLTETEEHVNRLEQVFEMLGQPPKAVKCQGMQGILDEAETTLGEKGTPETLDAAIIASAQKVEHYEIASYGSVVCWASMLNRQDVKDLLSRTLEEEKQADRKLTDLAKSSVNMTASQQGSERRLAA